MQLYQSNDTLSQKFKLRKDPNNREYFAIRAVVSDKALDVKGGAGKAGTPQQFLHPKVALNPYRKDLSIKQHAAPDPGSFRDRVFFHYIGKYSYVIKSPRAEIFFVRESVNPTFHPFRKRELFLKKFF